jgi:hypothetical protein
VPNEIEDFLVNSRPFSLTSTHSITTDRADKPILGIERSLQGRIPCDAAH